MEKAPKLRYIEAIPIETEQGPMIALRDPMGLSNEMLLVSHAALAVLQLCDGTRRKREILRELENVLGFRLDMKTLDTLLERLDAHYLLDNAHFRNHLGEIEASLLSGPVRKAVHAGQSYPDKPELLQQRLTEFFLSKSGAGLPGPVNGLPTPKGIIAPHIDLRIGGSTYTHAYRRLAEAPQADVYVILGTGHAGIPNLYAALPADFETPLGRAETDRTFLQHLQANYTHDLYENVFLHKTEHTIEFQVVFLQQTLKNRSFKIVPILCSFSYHALTYADFTRERRRIQEFTSALRKTIREYPKRVTIIASVDLAHVGPRYGDRQIPDALLLREVEKHDRQALAAALRVDADGWLNSIAAVNDRYRICGFSPIYTLLASVDARRGELLRYDQGLMDDQKSVVSYCSAVLY